ISGLTAGNKEYDGTVDAVLSGGTLEGKITGDDVTATMPASGSFADKNVGIAKTVSISAISLSGVDKDNYALTQPTGLTADITAKTLIVSGNFSVADKEYDGTLAATIADNNIILSGFIFGDDVDFEFIAEFSSSDAGTEIPVYITEINLTGADMGNYILSTTNLPETKAEIFVTVGTDSYTQSSIGVYPNPFKDYICFSDAESINRVTLFNVSGQLILEEFTNGAEKINIGNIPAGVYTGIVEFKDKQIQRIKLIKE
ncbi:MAG: T9SS type A sorting domain-containing protein, partial [Bacteroidales bacterium]|nr:T9SS type A sorting domain-containing protein [Bacteroidales bacterium]